MKAVVAVWAVVGMALALSLRVATEYLWTMSFVPILVWGVAGATVGIELLSQMRDQERRGTAGRQAVVMIAVAALFVPTAQAGGRLTVSWFSVNATSGC
jgi:hypothetical protein